MDFLNLRSVKQLPMFSWVYFKKYVTLLAVTNVVLAYDIRHDSDSELTGREPSSGSGGLHGFHRMGCRHFLLYFWIIWHRANGEGSDFVLILIWDYLWHSLLAPPCLLGAHIRKDCQLYFLTLVFKYLGLPRWLSSKESTCNEGRCGRPRFDPWVGRIPWRRAWQPTLVFLLGESHGQWSLAGCSNMGVSKSRTRLKRLSTLS